MQLREQKKQVLGIRLLQIEDFIVKTYRYFFKIAPYLESTKLDESELHGLITATEELVEQPHLELIQGLVKDDELNVLLRKFDEQFGKLNEEIGILDNKLDDEKVRLDSLKRFQTNYSSLKESAISVLKRLDILRENSIE